MDDSELVTIIDRERDNGIGLSDTIATDRQDAMSYYLGEASGALAAPEVEGRSGVVSKDMMETIEWVMPSLMRMFCGADNVVRFEPNDRGDEQACKDATEYCAYLLHRKNPGFTVLHDAFKSALITRMGVAKVYPDKTYVEKEERYHGLSEMELQALSADHTVEIVAVEPAQVVPDPQGQAIPTYNVVVKRRTEQTRFVVEGVPPEEVTFSKETRDIAKLRFVCHAVKRSKSDLRSLGYAEGDIAACFAEENDQYSDAQSRSEYDGVNEEDDEPADRSQRTVTLIEAYLRVDYDGDGIAEYRRVVKAGKVVFENEVTDEHPFALFTPVLMPYKLVGLSFYDLLEDLQQIKTVITRQMLDSMYLANNPRTLAVADQVNLDDLLSVRPGGVVRTKRLDAVMPLPTQDISASAQASIVFFNQIRDSRSGVKEYTQGLVGNELSQSQIGSQGVAMLTDAAAQRIELIARVFAETGITRIYRLLLKLINQYQDYQTEVKINGHWLTMDPRSWKNEYDMTVSVGVGTANKDKKLANAQALLTIQQAAAQLGFVQPQNAMNAFDELCEAMGYRDVSRFFTMPQPQPPQPSPIDVQMQLEREKSQMQMQLEQAKQQAQAAEQRYSKELEMQRDAQKAQNDMAIAQFKAEKDAEVEMFKARLERETALDVARLRQPVQAEQ